ncbi:acyltransferase [Eubacterium limosum]|uniref:acyltransferase n=1 Tax=Eubacterium limosum TaxID=1736 RepID=UPI0022E14265|nr:acyltransferase [Eubacterium limosum]
MEGFYTEKELEENFHFKSCGKNVLISKKASLYMTEKMSIGHDVRIDDFALLIGNITIGNYVHIAAYSSLHASSNNSAIIMGEFSGLSSNVTVYAASDDYSGEVMTNPTVPEEFKNTLESEIMIGKHGIIGTNSVLLPGAVLAEGVSIGAMSLLSKTTDPWGIYVGIPCKKIKNRKKTLLDLELKFLHNNK